MYKNHICELRLGNKFESDLRINEHYSSSSENKAWKKFRLVRDLNPWPLRYWANNPTGSWSAVNRYDFHKFTVIYSSLHGFIWNKNNDQLPVGIHDGKIKCFQLSLFAINAIGTDITLMDTSPSVKDTFISMTQLQPWLIRLPFEYGEYGTRKHNLSTGWKKTQVLRFRNLNS